METNLQLHGGDRKNNNQIDHLNCSRNCLDMHAYLHLEPPTLLYMHAHLVIHVTLFYWDLLPLERSPYLLQRGVFYDKMF